MRCDQAHSHATLLLAAAMLVPFGCDNSAKVQSSVKPPDSSRSEDVVRKPQIKTTNATSDSQVDGQSLDIDQQRSIDRIKRSKVYTEDMMVVITAEVEIPVYGDTSDEITLQVWKDKWENQLEAYSLTGGCGCCVDIYTITGPKAAIEEFSISEYRRKYYPKYRVIVQDGR